LITFKHLQQYSYFIFSYLQSLLGQKNPVLGGMKLTHVCNLTCNHCPFWKKKDESLSFEQAISRMLTLYEWGVRILIIEGGEPFLWRDGSHDIRDLVREAKKLFFSVGVTTNGTFPIEVDTDIVWVSLDGLKETNDRIRGESFDKTIANIEASSHPKIYAHVTINALNWQEIPDFVEFISSRVKGITIQFHYPYESEAADDELLLSSDCRREVLNNLVKLKKQGFPVANSYACLKALKDNRWKCHPWMIASVNPDGSMSQGCYVKDRGPISCEHCGFAAHTEISLAYNWSLEAMLVGRKIFERT